MLVIGLVVTGGTAAITDTEVGDHVTGDRVTDVSMNVSGLDQSNSDGGVAQSTDGLREAIDHWRDDDVDTDLLCDVIDAWRSGEAVV